MEVAHLGDRADIIVLPPLCPVSVSPIDFRASDELMSRAHRVTGEWLDRPRRVRKQLKGELDAGDLGAERCHGSHNDRDEWQHYSGHARRHQRH